MNAAAPAALRDDCSGAELLNAIAEHAFRTGVSQHMLLAQLSSDPRKWKQQVSVARRPKPHTIARVRALLSGEVVPAPPANNFQSENARRGGKSAEAEVLHRYDSGQSARQIMAEAGIAPAIVRRALSLTGDDERRRRREDCEAGSDRLREAVARECAAREKRRRQAASIQTVGSPIEHEGSHPILRTPSFGRFDERPRAAGRDPCSYCGVRGDIGCKHQRPA